MRDEPVICRCLCHRDSVIWYSPDVRDPVAAVTACSKCLGAHTVAIVSQWPPPPPPANPLLLPPWVDPPESGDATGTQ